MYEYQLKIDNMTCGHCAKRVTQAVMTADATAQVDINLDTKSVVIESRCELDELTQALDDAGYPAQVI